jgi:ribonuclease T1
VKWDRQTVKWVAFAFAIVAFVSLMLALGEEEYSITLGGDEPASSASDPGPAEPVGSDIESGDVDDQTGLRWILEDDLPVFAQGTLAIIDQGGPFPFDRDGITFENREGILPDESRGYYREYTVIEPGSTDRGPLRIVTGDGGEYYWTEDHYDSFERILRRSS